MFGFTDQQKIISFLNNNYGGGNWKNEAPVILDTYKTLLINKAIPVYQAPDATGRDIIRAIKSKLPVYSETDIRIVLTTVYSLVKNREISFDEIDLPTSISVSNTANPNKFDLGSFLKDAKGLLIFGGVVAGLFALAPLFKLIPQRKGA